QVLASVALIADELNLKAVTAEADESAFTTVQVKPNFKTLGKRCGSKLGALKGIFASWGFDEVARLEAGESIEVEGEAIALEDVILQRSPRPGSAVATDGQITVVLDTSLDRELEQEGFARELVSLLQNVRKSTGLEITDRIRVRWSCQDPLGREALARFADTIQREVLANELEEGAVVDTLDVNGVAVGYSLERA